MNAGDASQSAARSHKEDSRPSYEVNRSPLVEGTRDEFEGYLASLALVEDARMARQIADALCAGFVTHTGPEVTVRPEFITLDSRGGGVSRKPANFLLNWRKLFDAGPDALVAAGGAVPGSPFFRTLVALYVWNKVWRAMEEPISETEASVIEALWRRQPFAKRVREAVALSVTNDLRARRGADLLDPRSFSQAVDRLVALDCIELESGEIWLREWVRKKI